MTTINELARSYPVITARHAELKARMDDLIRAEIEELSHLESEINRFDEVTQRRRILNLCGAGYSVGDRLQHPDFAQEAVVGLGDRVTVSIGGEMREMPLMEATRLLNESKGRGPAIGDWNRDGIRLGQLECWDAMSPTWQRTPRKSLPEAKSEKIGGTPQLGLF